MVLKSTNTEDRNPQRKDTRTHHASEEPNAAATPGSPRAEAQGVRRTSAIGFLTAQVSISLNANTPASKQARMLPRVPHTMHRTTHTCCPGMPHRGGKSLSNVIGTGRNRLFRNATHVGQGPQHTEYRLNRIASLRGDKSHSHSCSTRPHRCKAELTRLTLDYQGVVNPSVDHRCTHGFRAPTGSQESSLACTPKRCYLGWEGPGPQPLCVTRTKQTLMALDDSFLVYSANTHLQRHHTREA